MISKPNLNIFQISVQKLEFLDFLVSHIKYNFPGFQCLLVIGHNNISIFSNGDFSSFLMRVSRDFSFMISRSSGDLKS